MKPSCKAEGLPPASRSIIIENIISRSFRLSTPLVTKAVLVFLRIACILLLLVPPSVASGQEQTADEDTTPPAGASSGPASEPTTTVETESTESGTEVFQLSRQHHPWARYQPGAWRKVQTITSVLDKDGSVTSRNMTTQTETLETVAEGKYVLKVQATVDLGGKQIVGEAKTRVLHIETDGAGSVSTSRRLGDRPVVIAGRQVEAQLWELRYQQGDQNLLDRVSYATKLFPYVLRRVTYLDQGRVESVASESEDEIADPDNKTSSDTVEEDSELIALAMPCHDSAGRIRFCACFRTITYRSKGDRVRLAYCSPDVPGGEISVGTTDFDADGNPVRISATSLLDHGGELAAGETPAAESPPDP